MAMVWGQGELFATASEQEIEQTEFYLRKYKNMMIFMDDFEKYERDMKQVAIDGEIARRIDQEDLHADKTANAVILTEKQKWAYGRYHCYTSMIIRAYSQILDPEVKEIVNVRFIQGHTRKETILFTRHGTSGSTVDRRIEEGIKTIAETLKLMGFFDEIAEKF